MGTENSRRFRLTIEYDGSRYRGWQVQTNAEEVRTIQGTLLHAAAEVFRGEMADIQGSGRTDAGVHALAYTAHLDVATDRAPEAIQEALNSLLPQDINLLEVKRAAPRFHARHHCVGRSYLYAISLRRTAFGRKYTWWIPEPLDQTAMQEAASIFTGMHDFAAFAEKPELKKSTLVFVNRVHVFRDGDLILVRLVASHFLWRMVRRLVGVLVEVGKRAMAPQEVLAKFDVLGAQRTAAPTAPAHGLYFEKAFYDQEELDRFCSRGEIPFRLLPGG